MTDEEKAATRASLHAKANGIDPSKPVDPAAPSGGGESYWTQAGRGVARGLASDIPGLSTSEFATRDDAGPVEQGARYVGEYGPLFVPGLDFGLGAKFGTKAAAWAYEYGPSIQKLAKYVGPDMARQMIHGLWDTLPKAGRAVGQGAVGGALMDPEHPLKGAATGAVTAPAVGAARAGLSRLVSPRVQDLAGKAAGGAATAGGIIAAQQMMGGRRGEEWPLYFGARQAMSPLLGLAAAATGRPALAGGAGALTRRWMGDDDSQQQ